MINKKLLNLISIFFVFILFFNGKKYDELVMQRLSANVSVCLEGQSCGVESSYSVTTSSNSGISSNSKVKLSEGSEHIVKMLNMGDGGQMIFEPAVLKVSVGDTIHFKATDPSHNSASMSGMIPEGAKTWDGPNSQDISVVLEKEGIYVYQCTPHLMMAMIGVIQVGKASNMDQIKASVSSKKSAFMLNAERLDEYLSKL